MEKFTKAGCPCVLHLYRRHGETVGVSYVWEIVGFLIHTGFDPQSLANTVTLGGDLPKQGLAETSVLSLVIKPSFEINCNAT